MMNFSDLFKDAKGLSLNSKKGGAKKFLEEGKETTEAELKRTLNDLIRSSATPESVSAYNEARDSLLADSWKSVIAVELMTVEEADLDPNIVLEAWGLETNEELEC